MGVRTGKICSGAELLDSFVWDMGGPGSEIGLGVGRW